MDRFEAGVHIRSIVFQTRLPARNDAAGELLVASFIFSSSALPSALILLDQPLARLCSTTSDVVRIRHRRV